MAFSIAGRNIGLDQPPYIIAEMSANHNGKFDRAVEILRACAEAGVDAVKLQTYRANTITIDFDGPGFVIDDGLWHGRKLYDLYEEGHTPWEWHKPLFELARKLGLTVFSSPFDRTAIDFLETLETPAYKIASFEATDLPLIKLAAAKGRPLIISTGMVGLEEIAEAVSAARSAGCQDLCLLHCVSGYPTPPEEANLATIQDLASRFGVNVGLSDHTRGIAVSVAAVSLGATVIEKHVTLRRSDGGLDAEFSLEPNELAELVVATKTAWVARGKVDYTQKASEAASLQFRRSLYVVADVQAGESLSEANIRSIRPGFGLPPKMLPEVLGKLARRPLKRGEPLSVDMFE